MEEIKNNPLQFGLGGEFAPRNSGIGVTTANRPKATEPSIIKASASFEKQLVFNEEAVTASFHELLPRLCKISKGQKIKVAFESGGEGWVKLLKPAYVTYIKTVDKNKYWSLRIPPVVKHPVYGKVWTLGFKNTLDPETLTKVRKFSFTEIIYNRKGNGKDIRKAEEKDLGEFINIWRDNIVKKMP